MNNLHTGIQFNLPREVYDADPGINQSLLKAFHYAPTPAHFKYEHDNPKEKECYKLGNAIDLLVSAPDKFRDTYILAPEKYPTKDGEKPWNNNATYCKEWNAEQKALGRIVLKPKELDQLRGMCEGLLRNTDIRRILETSQKQVGLFAMHDLSDHRFKGLVDLLPDIHSEWLFDLKKTGIGAGEKLFFDQVCKFGYHIQASFYITLARSCGVPVKKFGFLVVEDFPPYETAIHYIEYGDPEYLVGEKIWREALPRYIECRSKDEWQGYPSHWTKVRFKKWQIEERADEYERLI